MVSGIYFCHWPARSGQYLRCEVLLHRSYHNDVPSADLVVAAFAAMYQAQPPWQRTPFTCHRGTSYISLWAENDMLLLAVARRNVDAMLVMALLGQLHSLVCHYFHRAGAHGPAAGPPHPSEPGVLPFSRDAVVDNYALVYELLDECVDFGLAQVTDYNILKEYIKMDVHRGHGAGLDGGALGDSALDSDLPSGVPAARSQALKHGRKQRQNTPVKSTHNRADRTDVVNDAAARYVNSSIVRTQVSAISWRPKGIFYPKNEIYIDVVEQCDFLYDLEARAVRTNEISGVCMVRSYLSGMPVCKLGLNERYISQVEHDGALVSGNPLSHGRREGNQIRGAGMGLMRVPITNVQFHLCVQLSKVYEENLVFFTPPDDEFRLFSYSVEQQRRKRAEPLLMVLPVFRVVLLEKKLQIMCTLHTSFRKRLHCNNVVVKIPVSTALFPLNNSSADNFRFKCESGEARFSVDSLLVFWAIGDLPGSKKAVRLMAELSLSSCDHLSERAVAAEFHRHARHQNRNQGGSPAEHDSASDDEPSPMSDLDKYYGVGHASSSVFTQLRATAEDAAHEISVSFEMPMFTYSGLKVTYLRVDEDTMKYTCFPWVRYATRASADSGAGAKFRYRMGPSNFIIL
ncbi:clathrin adaptor, mu subunit [Metschnikowia bicuspidata var. bicuspidata NRRL YB-4993]|uniref:Clathrin adaptor, mu subunit n=1 Tax=Metschnikowia bicuspidata var. bicuspidata NRRL YB-4993 TaxID=869754 RepID=A0A1A0HK14_9ASCO|nr:clathrin adaptor, mu subunit [Metschnikowia bicuspidata var. bicuspidata NRRL YB-4993]OBA24148.1 clathrin adaptor, mu subunit [Metschnikowia bicuspidata var. bicuspidata NRRL YB-4993]